MLKLVLGFGLWFLDYCLSFFVRNFVFIELCESIFIFVLYFRVKIENEMKRRVERYFFFVSVVCIMAVVCFVGL